MERSSLRACCLRAQRERRDMCEAQKFENAMNWAIVSHAKPRASERHAACAHGLTVESITPSVASAPDCFHHDHRSSFQITSGSKCTRLGVERSHLANFIGQQRHEVYTSGDSSSRAWPAAGGKAAKLLELLAIRRGLWRRRRGRVVRGMAW